MPKAVVLLSGGLDSMVTAGIAFWAALAIVVAGTLALYAIMFWAAPRLGLKI